MIRASILGVAVWLCAVIAVHGERWCGQVTIGEQAMEVIATRIAGDSASFTLTEADQHYAGQITTTDSTVEAVIYDTDLGTINLTGSLHDGLARGEVISAGVPVQFFLRRLADVSRAELEEYVDWYEQAGGEPIMFTWGAHAGIKFYDFNDLAVGTRLPVDDTTFARLDETGEITQRVRFSRSGGSVVGVRWIDENGDTTFSARLPHHACAQEEVWFESNGDTLSGLVLTPTNTGPWPGAMYIHGSGANNTRCDFYDLYICQYLARNGVAVLLPDKRGSGQSAGNWRSADFEQLARDALSGMQRLRDIEGVNAGQVGVVGFSEGGWVAPAVGALGEDVSFVVDISGSAMPMAETVRHEIEMMARDAGLADPDIAAVLTIQELARRYIEDSITFMTYDSALGTLAERGGALANIAAGFPQTPDHWRWGFYRTVGNFDPMPYWQRVTAPALVIYGEEDSQVPVSESVVRLEAAMPEDQLTVEVFEESGHGLGNPDTGWIRRDMLERLVDWIKETAAE